MEEILNKEVKDATKKKNVLKGTTRESQGSK